MDNQDIVVLAALLLTIAFAAATFAMRRPKRTRENRD